MSILIVREGELRLLCGPFAFEVLKGELRPEISLLHMKVLTLIKAKSNVFL